MNTDKNRELLWRTVPFVMAMLLLALTGIPASAIFGREKAAPAADAGAPIAQSIDVRVYRGIPYTGHARRHRPRGRRGELRHRRAAVQGHRDARRRDLCLHQREEQDRRGPLHLHRDRRRGSTSAPAEVRITIARAKCGVTYDDMAESAAYTAAVDLAEHGVFVGRAGRAAGAFLSRTAPSAAASSSPWRSPARAFLRATSR